MKMRHDSDPLKALSAEETLNQIDSYWDYQALHDAPEKSSITTRGSDRVKLVAEGDSWFDFPPGRDVIDHLKREYKYDIRNVSKAGACMYEMAYGFSPSGFFERDAFQIEQTVKAIEEHRPQGILLSGGGNDFVGPEFILALHHRFSGEDGANMGLVRELFKSEIKPAYQRMITVFSLAARRIGLGEIPIFIHGYDYVFPDGRKALRIGPFGFYGPWMHDSFNLKGYPYNNDPINLHYRRMEIIKIIDELYAIHQELVQENSNVRLVELRETLPNHSDWNDELHPTSEGFKKIAARFHVAIQTGISEFSSTTGGGTVRAAANNPSRATLHRSVSTELKPLTGKMDLKRTPVTIGTPMEPRLQALTHSNNLGHFRDLRTTGGLGKEISVMARVTDPAQWMNMSEVSPTAVIGPANDNNGVIVTGRIPLCMIEQVRKNPNILSLKSGSPVAPELASTLEVMGTRQDMIPEGLDPDGGKGVIVGIIDYGCDFAHKNFVHSGGNSRILEIWDQKGQSNAQSPMGYGRVYTQEEINRALASEDPYATLGYGPPMSERNSKNGSHGTHVMDIAVGNGRGSGVCGCAPSADIVFVEVGTHDISFQGPDVLDSNLGNSVMLLEAIKYIIDLAVRRGQPWVINVSLGTNGGPHDGSTLFEAGVDSLLKHNKNGAVIIAASNSYSDGIHASGNIAVGETRELEWDVPNPFGDKELEIWIPGKDRLAVELIQPNGQSLGVIEPGDNASWVFPDNNQVAVILSNRLQDPNNGDNNIGLFLADGLEPGIWRLLLHGRSNHAISYHAWIERLDSSQSRFIPPHDNSYTLGSIACGMETITVASYDGHKESRPISWFSSEGPTRDGRHKPEVSAPGQDVWAANSGSLKGVCKSSGTSMAAPAVSGLTALLLAEAKKRGMELSSQQIRNLLIRSAHLNPPDQRNEDGWNPRYGYGRAHIEALLGLDSMTKHLNAQPAKGKSSKKKNARSNQTSRRRKSK